jgi:hypothetical protein
VALVPRLLRPSVIIRRNATYKGLLGGHKGWLAVGVVLWSKSFVKKTFGKQEEILTTEKLTKGQFLRIDAVAPPSRRQRRKAKRARRRSTAAAKAATRASKSAAKAASKSAAKAA